MAAIHWKHRTGVDSARFLATEAAGLDWIRVPGGPRVPVIVEVGHLTARDGAGSPRAARRARWPSSSGDSWRRSTVQGRRRTAAPRRALPGPDGWIGDLPMPYAARTTFAEFWALDRIAATARMARDRGGLDAAAGGGGRPVRRRPPRRRHRRGSARSPGARCTATSGAATSCGAPTAHVWLIDPAAHGGHPESDLAMLALFGVPHLDQIIVGYQEVQPLAPGWQARIPLHQAWPLLVHAALFGGGYGDSAVAALRRARG